MGVSVSSLCMVCALGKTRKMRRKKWEESFKEGRNGTTLTNRTREKNEGKKEDEEEVKEGAKEDAKEEVKSTKRKRRKEKQTKSMMY